MASIDVQTSLDILAGSDMRTANMAGLKESTKRSASEELTMLLEDASNNPIEEEEVIMPLETEDEPLVKITTADNITQQEPVTAETFANELDYYVDFNVEGTLFSSANVFRHYPMVARTTDGKELANNLNKLSKLAMKYAHFEFRSDAWLLHPVEFTGSDIVIFKVLKDGFDNYYCPSSFSMIFELSEISTALECLRPGDKQTVTFKVNRDAQLEIELDNPGTKSVSVFTCNQVQGKENTAINVPAFQADFRILTPLPWYKDAILSSEKFAKMKGSESVTFRVSNEEFEISTPGCRHVRATQNKLNRMTSTVDSASIAVSSPAVFEKKYGVEIVKTLLVIMLANKHSLHISGSNQSGVLVIEQMHGKNAGCLQYLLAPKLDIDPSGTESNDIPVGAKRKAPSSEMVESPTKRLCTNGN